MSSISVVSRVTSVSGSIIAVDHPLLIVFLDPHFCFRFSYSCSISLSPSPSLPLLLLSFPRSLPPSLPSPPLPPPSPPTLPPAYNAINRPQSTLHGTNPTHHRTTASQYLAKPLIPSHSSNSSLASLSKTLAPKLLLLTLRCQCMHAR